MPQRVYATATDFYDFVGEDAPEAEDKKLNAQLRSASEEVDSLTRLAKFDVDPDGYPSGADEADAFMRAACAIVQFWGITEDETGAESLAGAVSIGSVSLGTTSYRVSDGDKLAGRIGVKAADILRNAGLVTSIQEY